MCDCIASIFTSFSQVIVGHPFDTAKVHIQNKQSIFNLHFKDLYRGYKYPLTSSIITNALLFPIYQRTKYYTGSSFISGFLGGALISPFVFVSDYYKISRQMAQKPTKSLQYSFGKYSVFWRESIAYSAFFGVYDIMRNQYQYSSLFSGAVCGVCNWGTTYPIDVIRCRQIAQQISILSAIKQGRLFDGITICLIRAVFVNAAVFYTYENVYNYLLKI